MRRILAATMAVAVLGVVATVAFAQNQYTVTANITPRDAGSRSDPTPVGLRFDYRVTEAQGRRPFSALRYSIRTTNSRVNTNIIPGCTAAEINRQGNDDECPSAARIGAGTVQNITGNPNDQNDQSVRCNLRLTLYNSRNNRAALFLEGNPQSTDAASRCAIAIATAIPARWARRGNGVALEFTVPESLRRPGGLANAVVQTSSSVRRIVRRGRGYLESLGGCQGGRRFITVQFTSDDGQTTPARSNPIRCTS
jgi:hypothetical protein